MKVGGIVQTFSRKHTDCAKGIACMLLLLHHLFYYSPSTIEKFTPLLMLGGVPLACILSNISKVCVAMFLMLSGYGVAALLSKGESGNRLLNSGMKVSVKMILKLMLSFWFIFILFVPWQGLVGHWTYESWYHIIPDFFGVADILRTSTINATWWYVSMALVCYAVTPLMYVFLKKYPILSVVLVFCAFVILEGRMDKVVFRYSFWLCNYYVGMILFEFKILDRITTFAGKNTLYKWIVFTPLLLSVIWLRYNKGLSLDPLLSVSIISFTAACLYSVPLLRRGLLFVGRHSGNIFFMHTFVYLYDFGNFIYLPKYAPLIYLFCLIICLLISMVIDWLKRIIKYNNLTKLIINKLV